MSRDTAAHTALPLRPIVLLSTVLYLSGSSLLACTSTTLTITKQAGFSNYSGSNREHIENIFLMSTLGTLIGSLAWGALSDTFGRRRNLVVCLLISLCFQVIKAIFRTANVLPIISFIACIMNGSIVIVKAYAGDILDSSNSAAGFGLLGVSSLFINASAVVLDVILFQYAFKPSAEMLSIIPLVFEVISIIIVLICVEWYLPETIRVKNLKTNVASNSNAVVLNESVGLYNEDNSTVDNIELIDINNNRNSLDKPSTPSPTRLSPHNQQITPTPSSQSPVSAPASAVVAAPSPLPSTAPISVPISKPSIKSIASFDNDTESDFFVDDLPLPSSNSKSILSPSSGFTRRTVSPAPAFRRRMSNSPPPLSGTITPPKLIRRTTSSCMPNSPQRRNVSFSGLVTVKVIGSESLAVGRLKSLNVDEQPLVVETVTEQLNKNATISSATSTSATTIGIVNELDLLSGLDKAQQVDISQLKVNVSNKDTNPFGATSTDKINDTITSKRMHDEGDYDFENGVFLEDEPDYYVNPDISATAIAAEATQRLLSEISSLRYANGAEFYEKHLSDISPYTILLKTIKSLLIRKSVLLSSLVYALNLCVLTAITLCFPVWLMDNSPVDGITKTHPGAYDPIHNPSGMGYKGKDVLLIISIAFILGICLVTKFFAMAMHNWKVVYCYKFGNAFTVIGIMLMPSLYTVNKILNVPFYSWLYVIAIDTILSFGGMWSLLCAIIMVNNSGYKWERGTVFGLAETAGCIGKIVGVLISKYYYDFIIHSKQPWPFDASMYWYSVGIFLYVAGDIAAYLPKSIQVYMNTYM